MWREDCVFAHGGVTVSVESEFGLNCRACCSEETAAVGDFTVGYPLWPRQRAKR